MKGDAIIEVGLQSFETYTGKIMVLYIFGNVSFERNIGNEVVVIVYSQIIVEIADCRLIGNQRTHISVLSRNLTTTMLRILVV